MASAINDSTTNIVVVIIIIIIIMAAENQLMHSVTIMTIDQLSRHLPDVE